MKKYKVLKALRGANIEGGVLLVGRIITRADLPAKNEDKFQKLVNDGWLVEVKDNGEIQNE